MKLDGAVSAIVTGGASGLGAATARALAASGVRVGILDTDADKGKKFSAEIGSAFAICDITNETSVDTGLAALRAANGIERILVNCAGIALGQRTVRRNRDTGRPEVHDLAAFRRAIDINLTGTFHVITKSAAAMMDLESLDIDGERGVIVTTASVAAEDGQIGQVAYAASKGGVAAMTLPIARDLADSGIRIVSILPGLFETPMFDGLPDAARQSLEASVPFPKRLGRPEEYARLVCHICQNSMLNGCQLRLDGAVRLEMK